MDGNVIALVIPIISIVWGLSYAMLMAYLRYRRDAEALRLSHAERLAAIEKGIELPPPPIPERRDTWHLRGRQQRRAGLVLLFTGIAITVAFWLSGGGGYLFGLLPASLGLALVVASELDARDERNSPEAGPRPPPL